MSNLLFLGQYIATKAGKTGLTVTVDVDKYLISDATRSSEVTAGDGVEGRNGLYSYLLAGADLALYQYVATFKTADATVDQQHIAALGLVVPDALVSSRAVAGDIPAAATVAAAVRAELNTELTRVDVAVSTAVGPAASVVADAVHDEVMEGTLTLRQITRLLLAVLAGKASGGGTATWIFRDAADTKARVTATVDSNGNRTAITLDGS